MRTITDAIAWSHELHVADRREAVRVISAHENAARAAGDWYVEAVMGRALSMITGGITVDYVAARTRADRIAAEHLAA